MQLSVILATYNAPEWLEKVIWGYTIQTYKSFDLVIADDGSTTETAAAIGRLSRQTQLPIRHVWHADDGFRKCRILNKAIDACTGDYLVFSDGDCVPSPSFLATHVQHAQQGRFLSGGLVRLPMALSRQITVDDILSQRATDRAWLRRHGLSLGKHCLLLTGPGRLGTLLDRVTTTKPTWNGHNASGWKQDILRVNGFDERMGYGGEDCELGERMVNSGIRPYQLRHRAVLVHLDHPRGYVNREILAWNRVHRAFVRQQGQVWTDYGIVQPPEIARQVIKLGAANEVQPALRKAA